METFRKWKQQRIAPSHVGIIEEALEHMEISNHKRSRQTFRYFSLLLLCVIVFVTVASVAHPQDNFPIIVLEQTVDSTSPKPGERVNFTISYSNPSGSVAYNVTLFEWIPSGLTFITSKPFYDGVSSPEEGFFRWSRGDVALGGTGTIIVCAIVGNVTVGTDITNTVHLAYEDEKGATLELTASQSITVAHGAGVNVYPDQIHGIQPSTGAETSYNITVQNIGNAPDVFNLSLSSLAYDPNPAGKEWTTELYNTTGFLIATFLDEASTDHSSWTNWGPLTTVSLEAGGSERFVIRVIEPGGTSGSGDAYFKVRLTATSQFDPNVSNSALTVTVVRSAVGISIAPDYERGANPGETVTYLHEVYNGGSWGGSNQTTVIDLNCTSSQGWLYSFYFTNGTALRDTDNSGWVDVGPLLKDESVYILFKVSVPYGAAPGLVDYAVITAKTEISGKFYTDTANDNTTVTSAPLVGVVKELVSGNPAYVGDIVTYRINVTNLGNTELVRIPLDDGFETTSLDFSSASPIPDSYSEIAGTLHWENSMSLQPLQSEIVAVSFVATESDNSVREIASVIDAEDEFGDLTSAMYINSQLKIVQLFTLTVTVAPPETLGGTFDITWTERGIDYSATFTTPKNIACDENTSATISNPQQYFVYGNVRYVFDNYSMPSPTILIQSDMTVVLNYRTQYRATFDQTGLDSTAIGIIVIVSGEPKTYADLPFTTDWLDHGTSLTFEYSSIVASSVTDKQSRLESANQTSPLIIMEPTTVTANHVVQYSMTFNYTGLDYTAVGTVVTISGVPKTHDDLPFSMWFDSGATVTYSYDDFVSSSISGKRFRLDSVTGSESPITVTQPALVTGNYVIQYYLTVISPHGIPGDMGWYDAGSTAYAKVNPLIVSGSTGVQYVFTDWNGDASGITSPSDPITMNGPKTATANWKTQYYLTVVSAYDSPTPASGWFDEETPITASVTSPWPGSVGTRYLCTGWTGTGSIPASGSSITVTFIINASSSITWNWKTQYYLTMSTNFGTISPGNGWHDAGTEIDVAAFAPSVISGERYVWLGWTGSGDGNYIGMDNPAEVTINSPIAQIATWRHEYQLSISTNFGTTSPSAGEHWVEAGTTVSIQAFAPSTVPNERYVWNGWTGGGDGSYSGTADPSSVTMNGPMSEAASWTHQYYLTVTSPYGSVSGEGWYNAGVTTYAAVSPLTVPGRTGVQHVFTRWSGDASGITSPSSPIPMDAPKMAKANWKTQYLVTFGHTGLDSTSTGIVVTVDAEAKFHVNLPFSKWVGSGNTVTYSYETIVTSSVSGKRFRLNGVTGPASPITVTEPATVTGNYADQYLVTFSSTGLDASATGTVVTVDSSAETYSNLPFSRWFDDGASASYNYEPIVLSSNVGKRFRLDRAEGPISPITVTEPVTVTGNYVIQYKVTFTQTGLSPDAIGTVVTVNGSAKNLGALPFETWADDGTILTYSYTAIVPSTTSNHCRLDSITGPASPITVTTHEIVIGNYATQYLVTFAQTGLDSTATGTILTVNGSVKEFKDLSFTTWVDSGDSLTYSYTVTVSSSMSGKRFSLANVTSPASPINIADSVTVTGNYKTQYYLTMNTNFGTVSPNSGWNDAGSTVQISAFAPSVADGEQYVWLGWAGIGSGSYSGMDNPALITMNGPITENAAWRHEYYLTVTSAYDSPSPRSAWFEAGTEITAYVTSPWPGSVGTRYVCTGWTGTGSVTSSGTTTSTIFTISEPSSINWNWKTQHYLTMLTNFGTVSPSSGWYDKGSLVRISAEAPQEVQGKGFAWYGWVGIGEISYSGLDNPANITINSPINETAHWKIVPELTIVVSNETIARCDRVVVYGKTLPAIPDGEVEITYTFPNGTQVIHTVQTDDEGGYNDTLLLGESSPYLLFAQSGKWAITADRYGDINREDATDSTTLGIEPAPLPQIPLWVFALLIVVIGAIFYIFILKRVNGKKLTHKNWRRATVILGFACLALGIIALALTWTSTAGKATLNGETYLVETGLYPFTVGSISITEIHYIGTKLPSLIDSAWWNISKAPGPVVTLYLVPVACVLALAGLYKPKTERQRTIKSLTLLIAGVLLLVSVAQSLVFTYAQTGAFTGLGTAYGVGLLIAMIASLLAFLSSLYAAKEIPTGTMRVKRALR